MYAVLVGDSVAATYMLIAKHQTTCISTVRVALIYIVCTVDTDLRQLPACRSDTNQHCLSTYVLCDALQLLCHVRC
jgi:hypothetical protein